ncbi:MAG: hypothetical protein HYY23_12555 [Verrucomicrobia bacterium]|nr:hypothetical protein [Verrucomicrobiota bacterium]
MAALLALAILTRGGEVEGVPAAHEKEGTRTETWKIERGQLSVLFLDNSQSPRVLSGIDALFHSQAAPEFDAFDPDGAGASAGLNFEHVISGHPNPANSFTPRKGKYELFRLPDGVSVELVRKAEDDPWALASTFRYTVREPHYVDFEFRCQASDPRLFGERGYAVLFFADYMNDVEEVPIYFRGVEIAGAPEKWIRAEAPSGHPDYNTGGTYRSIAARDLEYDRNHNFKLNLWSYDYPRFTQPFYYGRAARGIAFMLMFDRIWSAEDEIRFSLFKFKVPRHPRPAWDFQYVIHKVEAGKSYGFRGRLVWKKFISPEDCQEEYAKWSGGKSK